MLNSVDKKILLVFILLGCSLLTILFIQIIPKMNQEQEKHTKEQLENTIYLTTQQLKLVTQSLQHEGRNRSNYKKYIIETTVDDLEEKIQKNSRKNLSQNFHLVSKKLDCTINISDKNKEEGWKYIYPQTKSICPQSPQKASYTRNLKEKAQSITISCNTNTNTNSTKNANLEFEYLLKKDIQNSFSLNEQFHKGKIYLIWIDQNGLKNSDDPLYHIEDDPYHNGKYCLSQLSNISFPKTGNLTGKQMINSIDKDPILHMIDKAETAGKYDQKAFTWVRTVGENSNRKLLFIMTVLEEDLDTQINASFHKILPITLISLLLVVIIGFFIIRRVFKSVNKLSKIAYQVNKGDISVRSGLKGKDDLGVLGMTFDNMLDTVEKNIHDLDNQVANRTRDLNLLLNEKETLLKEIHHRVKNNFAMTIELVKLQKIKIYDATTKDALSDLQERIHVMELLHRKLYESKNLSSINMQKYIEELSYDISNGFNNKEITMNINIEKAYLMDIEYALPCGLIINECLTNSFKHAFDQKGGDITISLTKIEDEFILKIQDSGKGMPDLANIKKSKTLGLRLISNIVEGQLLGFIDYSNENGSTFIVKFHSESS